jgi:Carboxypeptidase regulatory-like domain/TonB-dependent Receptor Plug Domain
MIPSSGRISTIVAAILLPACICWSQTNVGRISGTVQDASGALIPNAAVNVTNPATGFRQSLNTDASGLFVFPSLPAGTYDLRVEHQGFKASEDRGLVLDAASSRDVTIVLDVGQITESVSVSATAEQVQTTSGNVGRVINEQQVSQIALNGREYTQLLRLVPGVMATTLNVFNPQLALDQQRVNGIRTQSSYFLVDGAENHDNGANSNGLVDPNIDAISEVKLDTSSYSAEFGGRAGATINLITKSGTREFHGTLFEFVRNDAFDARSFFAIKVDPLRFNDFGGTLGGPVFVPGKFNTHRDKLFFFFSEEWKYTRLGQTMVNTVPTAAERVGDFRASTLPAPVDPRTGTPFADRTVPSARFSKNGPLLLKAYPLPNFVGPGGNYVASGVAQTDYREELLRLDYNISAKTQLSYRFTNDKWYIVFPFRNNTLEFVPNPRPRPSYLTSISLQHTFSPTLLNYFSFSIGKNSIHGTPDDSAITRAALGLTFPEIFPANRSAVAPAVSISGFSGYNSGDRIKNGNGTFQWRDDFTKVAGPHTLKFGAQITRGRKNENTNVRDEGSVTFNTSALNSSRNVIADALLGNFQNYNEPEADAVWWSRFSQLEFYAQDRWKATRRLSLELGLRYNIIPAFVNAQGNASTWLPRLFDAATAPQINRSDGSIVPGTGDLLNGIAIWGDNFPAAAKGRLPQADDPSLKRLFRGIPRGGNVTNWNDWGPRIGVAYDLFGNGKTAIRSGFGIFYDRVGSAQISTQSQNPPFVNVANIFDGNIDNPAGGTTRQFPNDLRAWPDVLPTPSVISWNFGIQQELPSAVIVEANYVANVSRHFTFTPNLNQLPVGTRLTAPNATINVNALRPYLGFGNIFLRDDSDNSNYNSLQVSVSRRLRGGLSFGANYTFSKTMDSFGGGTPQDSSHPKQDIGLSSIHRAEILNFNYIYSLPFFEKSGSRLARQVLGGWEISGVTSFQSGAPTTVTAPVDAARIGASSSRATVLSDPDLDRGERTPARWFKTESFLNPALMAAGVFGNGGRNILIGPGFQNWDVSLLKVFHFRETTKLQFRAESFNVFNHTNFTGINTTVRFDNAGNPTGGFGAVNASGPGRVLSLGLKLLF